MTLGKIDGSQLHDHIHTNSTATDPSLECIDAINVAEIADLGEQTCTVTGAHMYSRRCVELPVQHIPPEILSHIFLLGLPNTWDRPHPDSPPLLYGNVCSFWRAVSQSTPILWATLHIVIRVHDLPQHLEYLTHEWLFRAYPYPLNLSIDGFNEHPIIEIIIKNSILPFLDRVQAFKLHIPSAELQLLFNSSSILPLLEDLDLEGSYTDLGTEPLQFMNLPQLRRVILRSEKYFHEDVAVFPWQRLMEISLRFLVDAAAVVNILSLTPSLQRLHVDCINYITDENTHCVHSLLSTLDIVACFTNTPVVSALLRCLTLPSLRHLSIDGVNLASVIDLQQRSSFSLETVSLNRLSDTISDDIVSFLRRLPDLTKIRFGNTHLEKPLLKALCYHPLHNDILPRLEVFEDDALRLVVNYQDYIDMIRTRWWPAEDQNSEVAHSGVTRLKSVSVKKCGRLLPEERQQIEEFRRQGLVVHLLLNLCPRCKKVGFEFHFSWRELVER